MRIRFCGIILAALGGVTLASGQNLDYRLEMSGLFDNREFKGDMVPQTIYAESFSPQLGVTYNGGSLMVGLTKIYEFGSTKENHISPELILYFTYLDNRFQSTFGVFPRTLLQRPLPDAFEYDSIAFFNPNIQGTLFQFDAEKFSTEFYCNWYSRQTWTDREIFRLVSDGTLTLVSKPNKAAPSRANGRTDGRNVEGTPRRTRETSPREDGRNPEATQERTRETSPREDERNPEATQRRTRETSPREDVEILSLGWYGAMTHYAKTKTGVGENLYEKFMIYPYLSLNLQPFVPVLNTLGADAGVLASSIRNRGLEHFENCVGFMGNVHASWKAFEVKNTLYAGREQLIYLDDHRAGLLFHQSDPFYNHSFYDRLDMTAVLAKRKSFQVEAGWTLHFTPGQMHNQQLIKVKYLLDSNGHHLNP